MCCFKSDELQLLNIIVANKVAMLCFVDISCLLNCIAETIEVPEGRRYILGGPHVGSPAVSPYLSKSGTE